MPRAELKKKNRGGKHVYTCAKCGKPIIAGENYYNWKFNFGSRYYQHAEHGYPKPSQLTNSKMGEVDDAVSEFDISGCNSPDEILAELCAVAEAANSVAQQYGESADTIESSWPSGNPTSESCRATADELESWADELEGWTPDYDEWDKEAHDSEEEWIEDCRDSAQTLMDDKPEYQG